MVLGHLLLELEDHLEIETLLFHQVQVPLVVLVAKLLGGIKLGVGLVQNFLDLGLHAIQRINELVLVALGGFGLFKIVVNRVHQGHLPRQNLLGGVQGVEEVVELASLGELRGHLGVQLQEAFLVLGQLGSRGNLVNFPLSRGNFLKSRP